MKSSFPKRSSCRSGSHGAALIIVLGFVVLLSVLALAFLSSATINRQVSKSSASMVETKVFSQGAIDTIVGDLRQEIVDGSPTTGPDRNTVVPQPTTNSLGQTIAVYPPQTGLHNTVMPAPALNIGTAGAALVNLLKESSSGIDFHPGIPSYAQAGVARASSLSTGTPSQNGHYFDPARWNKPLLMPTTGANDFTPPKNTFQVPDWILVARNGTNPAAYGADLSDPSKGNFVVGRYAYTVYDEGGLLDANVAGEPPPLSNAGTSPAVATLANKALTTVTGYQAGPKTAESFADLTQIGLQNDEINALVGWRNFSSAKAGGSFPGFTFGDDGAAFFHSVFLNSNGFTTLGNTTAADANNPQTDRAFPTRQAMIQFFLNDLNTLGDYNQFAMQNSLQYLTSYSRDVNAPSYWPDHLRPKIIGNWVPARTSMSWNNATANWSTYQGNNDEAPGASALTDDDINPSFLSIRVGAPGNPQSFTRIDGSLAKAGDPLVNKRFPLNRLAWLTYLGPCAPNGDGQIISGLDTNYTTITEQAVGAQTLKNGSITNIYNSFGLTWLGSAKRPGGTTVNVGNCWTYYHKTLTPPVAPGPLQDHILTLAEVAQQGRDPDFFELLKAAICAGSIGKGAATSENSGGTTSAKQPAYAGIYQHTMDTTTDYQILQIGANIIDQFDVDGFPTWIQFNNGSAYGVKDIFGVEDLPYLYGTVTNALEVALPSPLPTAGNYADTREVDPDTAVNPNYKSKTNPPPTPPLYWTAPSKFKDPTNKLPTVAGSSIETLNPQTLQAPSNAKYKVQGVSGLGVLLINPVLWKPYDAYSTPGVPAPTHLRFTADSTDPSGQTSTSLYSNWDLSLGDDKGPDDINVATGSGQGFGGKNVDVYTYAANSGNPFKYVAISDAKGEKYIGTNMGDDFWGDPPGSLQLTTANSELDLDLTQNGYNALITFREPTILMHMSKTTNYLKIGPGNYLNQSSIPLYDKANGAGSPFSWSATAGISDKEDTLEDPACGVFAGSFPLRILARDPITGGTAVDSKTGLPTQDPTYYIFTVSTTTAQSNAANTPSSSATCRLAYQRPDGTYQTYDQKFVPSAFGGVGFMCDDTKGPGGTVVSGILYGNKTNTATPGGNWEYTKKSAAWYFDPRTPRFAACGGTENLYGANIIPGGSGVSGQFPSGSPKTAQHPSPDPFDVIGTTRPDGAPDIAGNTNQNNPSTAYKHPSGKNQALPEGMGWYVGGNNANTLHSLVEQNNPWVIYSANGGLSYNASNQEFYEDPDGVVRRGSGAYCTATSGTTPLKGLVGLMTASSVNAGLTSNQGVYLSPVTPTKPVLVPQSRPIMLNRPFRSVADLAYVFRDEPFKNIDFFTPESGDVALLDVFCIDEDNRADGLIEGKVNLNTQQAPVLWAILNGAYRDELINAKYPSAAVPPPLTLAEAKTIANLLTTRTSDNTQVNTGQLANVSDLVGKFVPGYGPKPFPAAFPQFNAAVSAKGAYDGFSNDLAAKLPYAPDANNANNTIQRYLETAIRALADVGTARTWNLMIDVVAQTGRFPANLAPAANNDHFVVEGEQRYWVHVAIDRYTGQVVDENVELVKE